MLDPSKDKFAYFKNNIQTAEDQDEFDTSQYYYNRQGTSGSPFLDVTGTMSSILPNSTMNGTNHLHPFPNLMSPPGGQSITSPLNHLPMESMNNVFGSPSFHDNFSQNSFLHSTSSANNSPAIPARPAYVYGISPGLGPQQSEDTYTQQNFNQSNEFISILQKNRQQSIEKTTPDLSDFPILTSRVGVMTLNENEADNMNNRTNQNNEFSIQNEDFPALSATVNTNTNGTTNETNRQYSSNINESLDTSSDLANSINKNVADIKKDVTGFGLLGLLQVIHGTNKDVTILACGTDLTSLGLNLNSNESLYSTFGSPWADNPVLDSSNINNSERYYTLPSCYYNQTPAITLKSSHFGKFTIETLFYIFYNITKDVLQISASLELYKREWMYHSQLQLWFIKNKNNNTSTTTNNINKQEQDFLYFDIDSWESKLFNSQNTDNKYNNNNNNDILTKGFLTEEDIRKNYIDTTGISVSKYET